MTPEAWHTEGVALYRSDRFDEALRCYNEAIRQRPDFAVALNSRGFVLQDMGRLPEATEDFSRAVALAPGMAMARLNLGMAQLKAGNMAQGWPNYEARWTGSAEAKAGALPRPTIPIPQWHGQEDTQGKRLLIYTEQGFGDTFQFTRYLHMAAQRFGKVGFGASPPTQRLMEWSFGDEVLMMNRLPATNEAWRDWDYHCPMMSLPLAFGTQLDSIPAQVPYLHVPPVVADHWRDRLTRTAPSQMRVGIAWSGRKAHQHDGRRSLCIEQLQPLLADARISWFCLQKQMPGDAPITPPPHVAWHDWTDEGSSDFADTAALISQLDLVISIDSAMVHLAGALGKPVWLLDRFDNEWRWLTGREDSPWYPTLRIFRQSTFGDWAGVIQRVRDALQALPAPRALQPHPSAQAHGAAHQADADIQQALKLAAQHQSAGRLAQAETVLRQLLQQHPRHAVTQHTLGVLLYQQGQAPQGLACIEEAVANAPDAPLFRSNLAEMYRQQGRLGDAIQHGERAVALAPNLASAWSNLGIAYYDAAQPERAQQYQERALQIDPRLLPALNNLGSIARDRKDHQSAAEWYRQALTVQPDYLESLSNLGAVLVESEDAEAAAAPLERALRLHPNYPQALCNLGLVRLKQARHHEAIALFQRCLKHCPRYPEAMVGLAMSLHETHDLAQARRLLEDVLAIRPDKLDAWTHLGTVCQELADIDMAERAYQRALAIDAGHADALTGIGNLRLEQGRFDEAEAMLRQAIAVNGQHVGARFHLTQARKVQAGDDNVAALEACLPTQASLKPEERVALHYALGKAYDDQQAWDKAFARFLDGARIKRSLLQYDEANDASYFQHIMDTVDSAFIARLQGHGDDSEVPVFVLGMPRSGTTLTEQIIASHPQAHGAGELHDLMSVISQPLGLHGHQPYPLNLRHLTPTHLKQWGSQYAEGLRRRAPDAQRITDKMPGNYIAMGLIPLMLPRARIIHVKRNAVDTCVSCFTRLFNRHQEPTYDLAELGRLYVRYDRLMKHWRSVMPEGSFMEVQYEDIVANLAQQARRLVDFVGLPWDEACVAFHENTRRIRTASVTQVRQPIYTSSVERWRHYERHLQPLLAELGDLAYER